MNRHVLLALLAAAIALGAGLYALGIFDDKSLRIAEVARDACYGRYAITIGDADSAEEAIRTACGRPLRDHEANRIWRGLAAGAVGGLFAVLIVGGIVIVGRRRRFRV